VAGGTREVQNHHGFFAATESCMFGPVRYCAASSRLHPARTVEGRGQSFEFRIEAAATP
jgi:hypothetical protein